MSHGLNYPGKFGSYLHKSRHNFSSYIVSLCKGKITSYKEGTRKYYDLEISDLEKDLIENSICSGNLFNKNINNKILHYPSAFTPNFINDIPDFNFEGFFVVPNSRPLEFSK